VDARRDPGARQACWPRKALPPRRGLRVCVVGPLALLASRHPGRAGDAWRRWQRWQAAQRAGLWHRPPLPQIAGSILVICISTPHGRGVITWCWPCGCSIGDLPRLGSPIKGGYYGGLISQKRQPAWPTHALHHGAKGGGMSSQQTKTSNTASSGADNSFDGFANSEAARMRVMPQTNGRGTDDRRILTIGMCRPLYELEILYRRLSRQ